MQECVSEFISFITSEAAEQVGKEKRKTINGEDVLNAMARLDYAHYAESLHPCLMKYQQMPMSGNKSRVLEPKGPEDKGEDQPKRAFEDDQKVDTT